MSLDSLRSRPRWMALFSSIVLMLAAMVPTVSRALATPPGNGWVEVCTATGMQWVQAEGEASAEPGTPPASGTLSLDHCPLCHLSTDKVFVLPPAPATGLLLEPDTTAHAVPEYHPPFVPSGRRFLPLLRAPPAAA